MKSELTVGCKPQLSDWKKNSDRDPNNQLPGGEAMTGTSLHPKCANPTTSDSHSEVSKTLVLGSLLAHSVRRVRCPKPVKPIRIGKPRAVRDQHRPSTDSGEAEAIGCKRRPSSFIFVTRAHILSPRRSVLFATGKLRGNRANTTRKSPTRGIPAIFMPDRRTMWPPAALQAAIAHFCRTSNPLRWPNFRVTRSRRGDWMIG